jgi:hypothetical protein
MTQLLFCGIDCVQAHPERGVFEFRKMDGFATGELTDYEVGTTAGGKRS